MSISLCFKLSIYVLFFGLNGYFKMHKTFILFVHCLVQAPPFDLNRKT
jgi:hypothetical protein